MTDRAYVIEQVVAHPADVVAVASMFLLCPSFHGDIILFQPRRSNDRKA